MLAAAAVVTGVAVHALFGIVGLLPDGAKNIEALATFAVDYTLWLNLLAVTVAAVLVVLSTRPHRRPAGTREPTRPS